MKNWKIFKIIATIIEICEKIRKNNKNYPKFWTIPQKIEYNFFSRPWPNFRKKTKLVLRVEIYNFFPDIQLFRIFSRIFWIFENRKKLGAFYALPFPRWKSRKKQWKKSMIFREVSIKFFVSSSILQIDLPHKKKICLHDSCLDISFLFIWYISSITIVIADLVWYCLIFSKWS